MAHFAQLDGDNIVLQVIVVDDSDCLDSNGNFSETIGEHFCESLLGENTIWKRTSYNTYKGEHRLGETPFRKNYAELGMKYDSIRDAFYYANQPYPSWSFNESTFHWEPPIADPNTFDEVYEWNEDAYQADNSTGWIKVEQLAGFSGLTFT